MKWRGCVRENRMLPIGMNTFRIFIDSCEGGQIHGKISGGSIKEPVAFTSLSRMVLLIEERLDIMGDDLDSTPVMQPGVPTFELEILFRQNYSWQGRLRWPSSGQEAAFHSVLELLVLMETILAQ